MVRRLLLSCLALASCLSCTRGAFPFAATKTLTTTTSSTRRTGARSAVASVAAKPSPGFLEEWGNKIEEFKRGCAEVQPKIIDLTRRIIDDPRRCLYDIGHYRHKTSNDIMSVFLYRPSDVMRELVVVGSNGFNSYLQGGGMGYIFGRMGVFKSKETIETYKRFFGDRYSHMLGMKQAKSYATFVSLFSIFEGIPKAVRGVDDQWNTVMASMGVGMYMARRMGTPQMIRSGMTFAAFTLMAERLRGPPKAAEEGAEDKAASKKDARASRRGRRRRGAPATRTKDGSRIE